MNLAEMKEKASCDYSLQENMVVALIIAGILLCVLFDLIALIATVIVESVYVLLLMIPITILGAVLLALLHYINPN